MDVRRWIPCSILITLFLIPAIGTDAQEQLWVGPNVNMVSGTTWPDGDPFLQRQNEPSVAVSTRSTMRLVGFTNDYRSVDLPGLPVGKETGDAWLGVYKSLDGGMTWKSTLLPGYPQDAGSQSPIYGYEAGADPVVRAGTHGLFYLTGIVFDRGDPARSALFLTRYMDLDNQESGDPIEFIDTEIIKANLPGDPFIDKPWMAVDIPRAGAQAVQIEVIQDGIPINQTVQCGNVYLAWAEIFGVAPNQRSTIMFSRSTDCGTTWEIPTPISAPDTMNQGVTMAVSPDTGDVWLAWRQFETDPTYLVCASGGGYWKTHPEEWPLAEITMGGETYDQAAALDILDTPARGDATYILAYQLIPAKLNAADYLLVGELQDLIDAADAWLSANPLGSKPTGAATAEGLALKDQLESFNNGEWATEGCTTSVLTPGTGNAIVASRSTDRGFSFGPASEVSTILPFEQATTAYSFRTNAYPTITVDNAQPFNRAYIAWTTRGLAIPRDDDVEGDARVVVSTSTDGMTWTVPDLVDQPELPGHQIVPSITFAGGKVVVVYYDLRRDMSGVFDRFIADFPVLTAYRHTVDVQAAQADPADDPEFTQYNVAPGRPSDQVSRYLFLADYQGDPGSPEYTDTPDYIQMKYNPPNLTIYLDGTRPFFGDYVDVAASPAFLPNPDGSWRYNTEPADGATFHVAWTDNRDIEAPYDGNWGNYVVPGDGHTSVFDGTTTVPACDELLEDEGQTKIRDQNTYTARLTSGLFVGSPGGSRPIGALQRAFVVTVRNDGEEIKTFRLSIDAPVDVTASFEQFTSTPLLDLAIAPYSGATRTVFVTSPIENDARTVTVEVTELGGDGLTGSVLLNGDPSSPPPADDGLLTAETYTPAMMNRTLDNPAMMNPAMMNLAMMNLAMMNPAMMNLAMMNPAMMNLAMMNLAMMNPAMMNLAMMNPAMMNPAMMNPAMMNLAMMNPAMMNPAMMNPAMMNPAMMNTPLDEVTWELKNDGTATAGFAFNLLGDGAPDPALGEFIYQLFIYREYKTPAADGCELTEAVQQQELVNVLNPEILDRNDPSQIPDLFDPDNPDTGLDNPTFYLDPGDTAYATFLIVDLNPDGGEEFTADDVWAAVVAQAVDTEDAANGETDPDYDTDFLMITTTVLPDATAGVPYSLQLTSTDGLGTKTWSLLPSGNAPPGTLSMTSNGLLSGTVTAGGDYDLTVQVSDGYEVDQFTFDLLVHEVSVASPAAPLATPIGGIVETPLTVLVEDGNGGPLQGYQVTLELTTAGASAHDNVATTAADGIATFDAIWFDRIGTGFELVAEVELSGGVHAVTAPSTPFDVVPLVVTTTADDGPGSLRRCIENANRNVNYHDTITFDTTGPAPHTISVTSPLPYFDDPITIDGESHPLYVDSPVVYLDGAGAGSGAHGIAIQSDACDVLGLTIINFAQSGIFVASGTGSRVENNYIGTDGTNDLGNSSIGVIAANCSGLIISGNVVSGNDNSGITLNGGVTGAVVSNNRIGTNAAGNADVGNSQDGIRIYGSGSSDNTISNNLISGNDVYGISLQGFTHDNTVVGNLIGTDETGNLPLSNTSAGIYVVASTDNTIGGTSLTDRNVISGNDNIGIMLQNATDNVIIGNYIGTDAGGTTDVGNGFFGIHGLGTSSGNRIGGLGAGEGNVISGNLWGVHFQSPSTANVIEGNLIGTDATGLHGLGNTDYGIFLRSSGDTVRGNVVGGNGTGIYLAHDGGSHWVTGNFVGIDATESITIGNIGDGISIEHGSHSNTIGGPNSGDGNVITTNGLRGIFIQSADMNHIQGNWIGTNSSLAGGMGNSDAGIVVLYADGTEIGGLLPTDGNAIMYNGSQGIELWDGTNTRVEGNLISSNSGTGIELRNHNGGVILSNRIGTDVTGSAALGNANRGIFIRDVSSGNIVGGPNPGDRNTVSGNGAGGIHVAAASNVVEGNFVGTDVTGTSAIPSASYGIALIGSTSVYNMVRGNVVSGNADGIALVGGAQTNQVQSNFVGTDLTGTVAIGNLQSGIHVQDAGTQLNQIGGLAPGQGNVISGNLDGIRLTGSCTANFVMGNRIGTTADGSAALGNVNAGVDIRGGAHTNFIGETGVDRRNLISGNNHGILLDGAGYSNTIKGNFIGTDETGTISLGNLFGGIVVQNSEYSNIHFNLISGNTGAVGIDLRAGSHSTMIVGSTIGTDVSETLALPNHTGVRMDGGALGNHIGVTGTGNVISGNSNYGVHAPAGSAIMHNQIEGNWIGTNRDFDPGLGNLFGGIHLQDDTGTRIEDNHVMHNGNPGGWSGISLWNSTDPYIFGNVASGNTGNGIILGGNTSGGFVQENRLGTTADGTGDLGNGGDGIHLYGTGVTLATIEGNLVSGNTRSGIRIDGEFLANGPYQNTVRGNTIGFAIDGITPIPNQMGVFVGFGAYDNIIGGTGAGESNTIAGNTGPGIVVGDSTSDTTAIGNSIISNSIYGNGGLGIDLSDDGITANDGGDADNGGNDQLNFPVLISAVYDGISSTNVTGTVHSLPGIWLLIQFFTNSTCDPSGNGEGQTYLGQTNVITDGGGNAGFSYSLATGPGGQITATASSSPFAGGNTSEFSACVPVT